MARTLSPALRRLARRHLALGRFARDESGTVLVEFILIFSFLMWAFVGTFVYFDAFRSQNTNIKAAYTVADLVSRQTKVLTPDDIEGMNKVFDFLNNTALTGASTHIRISDVYWDYTDDVFKVRWSDATRDHDPLTNQDINNYASQLPKPALGDTEIVVETWMTYTPAFNVGISSRVFYQFVVTRPRMSPDVAYSSAASS